MMTQRQVQVTVVVAALLLTGCGPDDDPAPTEAAVETDEVTPDAASEPEPETGTVPDEDDSPTAADDEEPVADDRPTGSVTVDQTRSHANGVEVTIDALRVEQDAIYVDVEVFNTASFRVLMAAFNRVDLVDDTGRSYNFRPPEDNPTLAIESGGTLEGTLAFLGRLTTGATSVTMRFNYNGDEELEPSDGEHADLSSSPAFAFEDLPLPGGDA